jgi:hypothetical protein
MLREITLCEYNTKHTNMWYGKIMIYFMSKQDANTLMRDL